MERTMQDRFRYDAFAVRTLHLEDPLLDALRREHAVLRKRLDGAAQRRGVTPMHAGHPRRDRAAFQRQED
jgi:hypothetical protein